VPRNHVAILPALKGGILEYNKLSPEVEQVGSRITVRRLRKPMSSSVLYAPHAQVRSVPPPKERRRAAWFLLPDARELSRLIRHVKQQRGTVNPPGPEEPGFSPSVDDIGSILQLASHAAKRHSGHGLPRAALQRRPEDIELATFSAVRALQMDVDGDPGVPSAAVLRKARLAIR
jgi:hypothetical protein